MAMASEPDSKRIGEAVLARRKSRRWTQQRLATEAGVSVSTVQAIEAGKYGGSYKLPLVTDALDISSIVIDEQEPADDVAATAIRLVDLELSEDDVTDYLLGLPDDKAERILAAYHTERAERSRRRGRRVGET